MKHLGLYSAGSREPPIWSSVIGLSIASEREEESINTLGAL